MDYEITLQQFSGPLDLLLHLIQKQELDIYDIPIAQVTEQYLRYLGAMEELSLEVASEFVVMAATLLAIKSRLLLPRKQSEVEEAEDLGDPREGLVQQLLEYKRCQWAALQLKEREALTAQIFSREPMNLRPFVSNEVVEVVGVTMWDLVDAFRNVYLRVPKSERVAEIKGHVVRVEDMMKRLTDRLIRLRRTTFRQLLDVAHTRPEVVSAFLALLELMKDGIVYCWQADVLNEIEIELCEASLYVNLSDRTS